MEDFTNIHYVALWGFGIAAVFGFVANKTHFCVMGGISDVLHMGSKVRLGGWFLAIGIAILGTQALVLLGLIDLQESRYLGTSFGWFGHVIGGLLFGIGMTLATGCGQRNLVRLGGGNLKSLVVLLVMGITAYMTLRGLLGLVRINYIEIASVDLSQYGMADQGLVAGVVAATGAQDAQLVRALLAGVVGLAFVAYALKQSEFRQSFENVLVGVVIGATVIAAWFVTGNLGLDDFDPVPVEGMSFIASTGNTVNYLMTFTGATVNFGIALVVGMLAGSFVYAVSSGNFRIETFSTRQEMVSHLVGAVLMGFGGVIGLGCSIGQGVTGLSTLSMGSAITFVFIIFGSALTMKVHYHLLDDEGGVVKAVLAAFGELLLPARARAG